VKDEKIAATFKNTLETVLSDNVEAKIGFYTMSPQERLDSFSDAVTITDSRKLHDHLTDTFTSVYTKFADQCNIGLLKLISSEEVLIDFDRDDASKLLRSYVNLTLATLDVKREYPQNPTQITDEYINGLATLSVDLSNSMTSHGQLSEAARSAIVAYFDSSKMNVVGYVLNKL
jgi:hypothetical protein